jgi:hypothetical protein
VQGPQTSLLSLPQLGTPVGGGYPTAAQNCDDTSATWVDASTVTNYAPYNLVRVKIPTVATQFVPNVAEYFTPVFRFTVPQSAPNGAYIGNNAMVKTDTENFGGGIGQWSTNVFNPISNSGVYSGERFQVVKALVRIGKKAYNPTFGNETSVVGAGGRVTFGLAPSFFAGPGVTSPNTNLDIIDVLPIEMSYKLGSGHLCVGGTPTGGLCTGGTAVPFEPSSITLNGSGQQVLTWSLPNVVLNTLIPPIFFDAEVPLTVPPGRIVTNNVTISSVLDQSTDLERSASKALTVDGIAGFFSSKKTSFPIIERNGAYSNTLEVANLKATSESNIDVIDVLPRSGDPRSPSSTFAGTVRLTGPLTVNVAGAIAYYTNAAVGAAPTALLSTTGGILGAPVAADFTIAATKANGWCLASEIGSGGCPATLQAVTGFRVQLATLAGTTAAPANVLTIVAPLTTLGNAQGNNYTNRFGLNAANQATPLISNDVVTLVKMARIGGNVFVDSDLNNSANAGEPGVGGVQVVLCRVAQTPCTAANTVATTNTNPDGSYEFTDLFAGTYFIRKIEPVGQAAAGANAPGTAGGTAPNATSFDGVVLNKGQSGAGYNFGQQPADVSVPAATTLASTIAGVAYPAGQTVSCTNTGAIPAINAVCAVSGLPAGLTATCSPTSPQASLAVGASIVCTISGTPVSSAPIAATVKTGSSNDGFATNNTGTLTSPPTPDVSVPFQITLPSPIAGVAYPAGQTVPCTNVSTTTAATAATCAVTDLPAGLTATCTPTSPVASLAPGASIVCTISGTPATNTPFNAKVTTSATDDGNLTNNVGDIKSVATADVQVPAATTLSPAIAGVPDPANQTVSCRNSSTIIATDVTCVVVTLPAGLIATCTPPSPQATLAPGAAIVCTISGTPTTNAPIDTTITTNAANDGVPGNNQGTIRTTATPDMSVPPTTTLAPTIAGEAYPANQTVSCTNLNLALEALNATCDVSGLPAGLTATCSPSSPQASLPGGASIVCTISGTPTTAALIAATVKTNAANDGAPANNNGVLVSTPTADMSVPAQTTLAPPIAGTAYPADQKVTCSNSSTTIATDASCTVNGLPAGLVATCDPASPQATLAAGASIVCTISGTPTTNDAINATVVTDAANDGVPANNNGVLTSTPTANMSVPATTTLAPTIAGAAYPGNQTVTCTNTGTVAATNATCAVAGLPAGLIATCAPSSPQASLAAGASIVCSISGVPTTNAPINATVSTGASNDGVPADNAGTLTSPVTADMQVPPTTTLAQTVAGVPYPPNEFVACVNKSAVTAVNATCAVSGLPDGLSAVCTPTSPQAALGPNQSIICQIVGTPTTNAVINATVTTGADNDGVPANNTGTLTSPPTTDLQVPVATVLAPPIAGVPYPANQTVTCTNISSVVANNATCLVGNLPPGLESSCSPSSPQAFLVPGRSMVCTISGTPISNEPLAAIVVADADNEGIPANNQGTITSVPTADVSVPALTTLTAPFANIPYPANQTVSCTNTGTVVATDVTCKVLGLPPGLSATCAPTSPQDTLAPGASIVCTISGTPTTSAPIDASIVATAGNDGNPGNNEGNIVSVPTPDVAVPAITELVAPIAGEAYPDGQTVACKNVSTTVTATNVTCDVTGLPTGLVSTCTPPSPQASLPPGESIVCTISGTPTSNDPILATVTASATGDGGPANDTGAVFSRPTADMSVPSVTTLAPTVAGQLYPSGQTVSCTNRSTTTSAINVTCEIAGLPAGLSALCTPTSPVPTLAPGDSIVCTIFGTPTTNAPINAMVVTSADNDGDPRNDNGTIVTVPTADMTVPPFTSLPTPIAGQPYPAGQTVSCTNAGTVAATNATCDITGLPPGLIVTCTPPSPQASLAPGASIVCTISGTPLTSDPIIGQVTAGASNEGVPIDNTGVVTSIPVTDMSVPAMTTLPQPIAGQLYPAGQVVVCTNTSPNPALNARCDVAGLPAGLMAVCTPPSPVATLAPGGTISCAITGTPTTNDPINATVDTGADNDSMPQNNRGIIVSDPVADMSVPDLTNLAPPVRGQQYPAGQTVTCTNNGPAAAINATCDVTGLPEGLIAVCTPPSPVAALPPGASIVCEITGTPTSNTPIDATVTTGSSNDKTPPNNRGRLQSPITDADGDGFSDSIGVSGGSCATGSAGNGVMMVLALGCMSLLRRRRLAQVATLGLAVGGATTSAQAQAVIESRDFTVERFHLSTDRNGLLGVEWGGLRDAGSWELSLWMGYANDPLVVYNNVASGRERLGALVHHRVDGELAGSYTLSSWLQLSVSVPLVVYQDRNGDIPGVNANLESIRGVALGDTRVSPKLRILRQAAHSVDLSLMADIGIPSGGSKNYRGDAGVTVMPSLLLSRREGGWRYALNASYLARPRSVVANQIVNDEVALHAGVGYRFTDVPLELDVTTSFAFAPYKPFERFNQNHLEFIAGPNYEVGGKWILFAGGGVGVL